MPVEQLGLRGNWEIRERIIYHKSSFSGEDDFVCLSIMNFSIWGCSLKLLGLIIRNERTKLKHLFLNHLWVLLVFSNSLKLFYYIVLTWFRPVWVWGFFGFDCGFLCVCVFLFWFDFFITFIALAEGDYGFWFIRTFMCLLSCVFITEAWIVFECVSSIKSSNQFWFAYGQSSPGGEWAWFKGSSFGVGLPSFISNKCLLIFRVYSNRGRYLTSRYIQ